MTGSKPQLLSSEFLRKLEQLELVSRKILTGRLKGERRSKRKGSSVEFADHKEYIIGDDLRFIDWNIFARLDKLFVKLFEEEEDLHFHILIDTSLSMDFGDPTKIVYAQKLAAALAFIGLANLDRVVLWTFNENLGPSLPGSRGKQAMWRVNDFLANLKCDAGSNLTQSCKTFALRASGKGVCVLISDLLDKNGFESGLRYLLAKQMDVFVVHVMAGEEVDPELAGDLQLIDVEDEDIADITVSAPLLARYRANVAAFQASIKDYCSKRGINYLFTTNQIPFEKIVLTYLRERGLVR